MTATWTLLAVLSFADGTVITPAPEGAAISVAEPCDPCEVSAPCVAGKVRTVKCKPARATVCEAPARTAVCEAPTRIVVHQADPIVEFRRSAPRTDAAVAPCGHGVHGHAGSGCNTCGGGAGFGAGYKHVIQQNTFCGGYSMLPQAGGIPMAAAAAPQLMAVPTTVTAYATVPVQVPTVAYQQVAAFQPAAIGAFGGQAAFASDELLARALTSALAAMDDRASRGASTGNAATAANTDLTARVSKLESDLSTLTERVNRIERKLNALCETR